MSKQQKRKEQAAASYKKGTSFDTPESLIEIREILNRSNEIYLIEQASYDDQTESVTIKIHFTPKLKMPCHTQNEQ